MTRAGLLRDAWLQTALWAALAVVAVDVAGLANASLDLTADQRHTLSAVAVDAARRLEKPVVARVFFTGDLAAPYHEHRRATLDLLDGLAAHSGGKLEIRESDPTGDRELADEARTLGIEPVSFEIRTWDRQEARQVYMGVAFVSGDRVEAAPSLTSIPHLEYDLVRGLQRVATPPDDRKKIGWLLGDGEPDPRTFPETHPLGRLGRSLDRLGELVVVNPGEDALPDDLAALLVVAPQTPIPAIRQLRLDQALMGGTAVAYFLAGWQPDFRAGRTAEVRHDLHPLLARYGVDVGHLLVLDRTHHEKLPLPAGNTWVQVSHPLAVIAREIDPSARPLRSLQRVVAPFATPISLGSLPPGVRGDTWIRIGDTAAGSPGARPLEPERAAATARDEVAGPFPLAVALEGQFPSAFTGRPLPVPSSGVPIDPGTVPPTSPPTRLAVFGSGDLVANETALVEATTGWLLDDRSLLSTRRLADAEAPFPAPPPDVARRWKLAIVGIPVGLLLAGAAAVSWRRR